jgi:hypothetical protein
MVAAFSKMPHGIDEAVDVQSHPRVATTSEGARSCAAAIRSGRSHRLSSRRRDKSIAGLCGSTLGGPASVFDSRSHTRTPRSRAAKLRQSVARRSPLRILPVIRPQLHGGGILPSYQFGR